MTIIREKKFSSTSILASCGAVVLFRISIPGAPSTRAQGTRYFCAMVASSRAPRYTYGTLIDVDAGTRARENFDWSRKTSF